MPRLIWNRSVDITDFCGEISLSDNLDSVTMEMTWSMPSDPQDKYLSASVPKVQVGDKVDLIGDTKILFSGIIVERDIAGGMTAYDYGFYLTNNDVILQLNTTAGTGVAKLCEKAGIPLGAAPSLPTKIKKVYAEESCAEILDDILEQVSAGTGKNYFWRVKGGKLNIYEYPTRITYAHHSFETGNTLDVTYALGSVGGSDSIKELRNAVQVAAEDNGVVKVMATAQDSGSIARFGRMLDIVKQSGEEQNPQTAAENKLRENNTVKKTRSVTNMLGSEAVEAGVLLLFSSDKFEVTGIYLVKGVTHTFGAGYTMNLDIIKPEVV